MPMIVCKDVDILRAQLSEWRNNNETIAFVPTMGNLHDGHLSLIEIAQANALRVVVSIYVNPLQFSPDEDFSIYPRTLEQDLSKLKNSGVALVFTPDTSTIYPDGEQQSTFVDVPALSSILEGEFRPGFFKGVATVVLKLFNMVQPNCAVFGEKDFQQLLVIRRMVKDLSLPIEIVSAPTKREADGLAMSSRNNYLNKSNREKSRLLSTALKQLTGQLAQGAGAEQAQADCIKLLLSQGFAVDYVSLRETSALKKVSNSDISSYKHLIVLAAVRLGETRLIDNIRVTVGA